MTSAQERAKALASEIKKAVRTMKAAEIRAKQLGDELVHVLAEAKAEAEAERIIVEYPSGRYECKRCRHSTLFTEPTRTLPECDNCGGRDWSGHEPKVMHIKPPAPKRYAAGMYECAQCGVRTALAVDADELSPCDMCGADKLKPL